MDSHTMWGRLAWGLICQVRRGRFELWTKPAIASAAYIVAPVRLLDGRPFCGYEDGLPAAQVKPNGLDVNG